MSCSLQERAKLPSSSELSLTRTPDGCQAVEAFEELLAAVRETARRISRVVHAIRHASLVPPPPPMVLMPPGPEATTPAAANSAGMAQSIGMGQLWRNSGLAVSHAGGQLVAGRAADTLATVPELQEFADHVERQRAQVRNQRTICNSYPHRASLAD